jgi:hypothetical protein
MFTTIERVKELTNADVTQETIIMAQNIVEAYIGRDEVEVVVANDKALLDKATAYQCAYMVGDEARVFEQAAATQVMQFGNMVTFPMDGVSPWVAPLTVIACKRLSWKRIRSIHTSGIFDQPTLTGRNRWFYE